MYWEYFGFEENPFSISPDPRYLYMSKRHQEALAHLVYGIGESGGFVLLSGEVGTGKTTICRSLVEQLPDNVDLAFVLNPRLNDVELLATICDEMAVAYPRSDPSLKVLVDRLNEHLLRAHAIGRQPVLLIDEAQNLDSNVLEQIRLLTNLETNKRKLLQIVLIGQPELNDILAQPSLRQLDQRITARYHLRPLTIQETGGYIRHRLQVGGAPGDVFSDRAIRLVYRATGGIPRLINTLCDRCLLGAYAENKRRVDAKLVRGAAKEALTKRSIPPARLAAPGIFAAAAAAAAFLLVDPLDLNAPRNVLSVTEANVPAEPMAEVPPPIAIADPIYAEEPAPADSDPASGLQFREVAAAEIGDLAASLDLPEVADEAGVDLIDEPYAVAAVPVDDTYPMPPRPPLPASSNAPEDTAIMARAFWAPLMPPSSAPEEINALQRPVPATRQETSPDLLDQSDAETGVLDKAISPAAGPGAGVILSDVMVMTEVATSSGASYAPGLRGAASLTTPPNLFDVATQPDSASRVAALGPTVTEQAISQSSTALASDALESALMSQVSASDLESALRTLFGMWNYNYAELKGLSTCKKARYASLRCMQGRGTWNELRVADRPAVITLTVGGARTVYVALTRLHGEQAEIMLGDGSTIETSVGALSRLWAGDYLLLWRPPAEFSRELKPGVRGGDVLWLRKRLLSLGWDTSDATDELLYDDNLQEAVRRFQRRRGLAVDGVAGSRTILQVNAALGAAEAPTIR